MFVVLVEATSCLLCLLRLLLVLITVTVFHNFLESNRRFTLEMDSDSDVHDSDVRDSFTGRTESLTSRFHCSRSYAVCTEIRGRAVQ
jgi:hypothetical protein